MPKHIVLLALAVLMVAGTPTQETRAQAERWQTYINPRFGTRADYPAHIFTKARPAPENSDGQTFTTPDDGAELLIYGAFNSGDDSPRSYVDNYIKPQGPLDYERVTNTFFVVSRGRSHIISYTRCNFVQGSPGTVHCFMIAYPGDEKERWDAIVTRIGNSLR